MAQRDKQYRLDRLEGAAGLETEQPKIRWTPSPAWLPAPRMAMPSPRTVTREQYADKTREFFPDIKEPEIEQGWRILEHGRATNFNGTLPPEMAQARPAPTAQAPAPIEDDLGLDHIH